MDASPVISPAVGRADLPGCSQVYMLLPRGHHLGGAGDRALARLCRRRALPGRRGWSRRGGSCWLFCRTEDAEEVRRELREVAARHIRRFTPPSRRAS